MPRIFSALEVSEEIRDELYRLHRPLPGARWVHRDNYHITLRYLGDIDRAAAREFIDNLRSLEFDPFSVSITGLGAFGGYDPSAVWANVDQTTELNALARAHEKAARQAGFPVEKRPFKPHITLARLRHSDPAPVAKFLTRFGGYRSGPMFVTRAVVYSSRPKSGGGPYAIEEILPMRGCGFAYDEDEHTDTW